MLLDVDARLELVPDRDPHGAPLPTRAIQVGLRGPALAHFARDAIVGVEDITAFVHEQILAREDPMRLLVPVERPWPVRDGALARRIGLDRA